MSATMDSGTDWQSEAIRLKFAEGMQTADIASLVGKHAATVRKVVARATEDEIKAATGTRIDPIEDFDRDNGEEIGLGQGDIEAALDKPDDPLHAFKREAGDPVGDMPKAPEPDAGEVTVRYAGTRQTCLDFGPNADLPTGGTLVIRSEKLASGHFGLGDVITGTFTARVTGFGAKEKFDSASEEYRAQTVPYVATITEISYEPVDGGE